MIKEIWTNVLVSSLFATILIGIIILLSNLLDKKYKVKWRYWIWLIVGIYLIIPIDMTIKEPLINIKTPNIISSEKSGSNENIISNNLDIYSPELNKSSNLEIDILNQDVHKNVNIENIEMNKDIRHTSSLNILNLKDFFTIENTIISIWLIGVFVFFVYHMLTYYSFKRKIRLNSVLVKDKEILEIFSKAKENMNISKDVKLKTSPLIVSPFVIGLFNKELLLPNTAFSIQQLDMILKHELIHIKKKDILYKFIILIARSIHWFNPFVHLMGKKANEDIELSCDLEVIENKDIVYREEYSKTILELVSSNNKNNYIFTTGFTNGKEILKSRFSNILEIKNKKNGTYIVLILVISLILISLLVSCKNKDIGIDYESKNLELSLAFPQSWEGRFFVEEKDDEIHMYSKKNYEDDWGGLLFTIYRKPGDLITEEDVSQYPTFEKIFLKENGYSYLVRLPSDVQFNIEDIELTKEYEEMKRDLNKILDTVKVESESRPPVKNDGYKLIGSSFFTLETPENWEVVKDEEGVFRWDIYVGEKENIGSIELVSRYADEEQHQDYATLYIEDEEHGRKIKISLHDIFKDQLDIIKDTLSFVYDTYTILDAKDDAMAYVEGGGKAEIGQISEIDLIDSHVFPIKIKVKEGNSEDSKEITKEYHIDRGASVIPLIKGKYNMYGNYSLDQYYVQENKDVSNRYYEFIIDRNNNIKLAYEIKDLPNTLVYIDDIELMKEYGRKDRENISVDRGMSIFVMIGKFEIPYEDELDYERFNETQALPDKYLKDTPFYKKWGQDRITYVEHSLNNCKFIAESDIPFSVDIYTKEGDVTANIKSTEEKGNHGVRINFTEGEYYIILANEDGKSTENAIYKIWR